MTAGDAFDHGKCIMFFRNWRQPGGYRDVLSISLPLMVSMSATTVMEFTDRVFLAHYSVDAIAAALPGAITSFLAICFFMGTAAYFNVFVAQYYGYGSLPKVGAAVWHGIYFSMSATLILSGLYFVAPHLFQWAGHPEAVRQLEISYFRILVMGGGIHVLGIALGCFFTGRGKTRPVMVVNIFGAMVNIPLDYALINGVWFFPELGIVGAGLATVTCWTLVTGLYIVLIFNRRNIKVYGLWREKSLDPGLIKRLMRFGLPAGVQFFLEIFAFTFFIFMVGRIGKVELVATNVAFSLDTLAFLPIMGLATSVSALVGQAVGKQHPSDGARITTSALQISMSYMAAVALLFILAPHWLVDLFRTRDISPAEYGPTKEMGVMLLRFVALYTIFDSLGMIYCGAIKGAGDTTFAMCAMGVCGLVVLVIPTWLLIEHGNANIYVAWAFATTYVCSLTIVFWWRYRQGKWRKMNVIEMPPRS